jgi:DhnA family fructose-bisphosphate aldolase class Ia
MSGLNRNVARLFDNRGKLFVVALDHPQAFGVMSGLENPDRVLSLCAESPIDGFILNPGLADRMTLGPYLRKKLILRTSLAGSSLGSSYPDVHENVVSPERALALGADAALMMLVLGGEDYRSMQQVARDIDAFHRLQIPCIVEILAADFARTNSLEIQMTGARIAAEIGADVVKAFFTQDFGKVVSGCPVPVILAGGPRDVAPQVFAKEARGFAFGRNVFQHPDPQAIIREMDDILRS